MIHNHPPRLRVCWKPRQVHEPRRVESLWYMWVLIALAVGAFLLTMWLLR